jgi:alkylhydroperoxidase family enzyme
MRRRPPAKYNPAITRSFNVVSTPNSRQYRRKLKILDPLIQDIDSLPLSAIHFSRHNQAYLLVAILQRNQPSSMRLPYVTDPPPINTPLDQAVVDRIRLRRAPRPLQALDLTLLHSPAVADGWNSLLGAIRTQTDALTDDIREIAICRVAVLNQAWYEWTHHYPLLEKSEGWKGGEEDLKRLRNREPTDWKKDPAPGLTEKQIAVLRYTDAMTRDVKVPHEVFEELKNACKGGEREIVEITAVIASYNLVSRFLVALDVGEQNKD